jgi:hypothetical protein
MPQTNVLPDWKATYPADAKVQKPGGVTISTTLIATAVPNKPQWTGTQMAVGSEEHTASLAQAPVVEAEAQPEEEVVEHEPETEEEDTDENGHPKPRRQPHRRRR